MDTFPSDFMYSVYTGPWHIQTYKMFILYHYFPGKHTYENHRSTLTFVNCLLPMTLLPSNTGDIYFTILCTFYLFKLLKSKCHQTGKCH